MRTLHYGPLSYYNLGRVYPRTRLRDAVYHRTPQSQFSTFPTRIDLSGRPKGPIGAPTQPYTVSLEAGQLFNGSQTVTITSSNSADTITPSVGSPGTGSVTVMPNAGTNSFTYTITGTGGTRTITITNGQGWTNPAPFSLLLTTVSTIGPGEDYSTLQAWADDPIINTSPVQQDAECYSGADLGGLIVTDTAAWGPPISNIYAAVGQRHDGTDAGLTGVAYMGGPSNISMQNFSVSYMRFQDTLTTTVDGNTPITALYDSNLGVFKGPVTDSPFAVYANDSGGTTSRLTINFRNNIVLYDTASSALAMMYVDSLKEDTGTTVVTLTADNNSLIDSTPGGGVTNGITLLAEGGGLITANTQNNITMSARTNYVTSGPVTFVNTGFNLSQDSTATAFGGTNNIVNKTQAATVTDPPNDPTLLSTSPALNHGKNLSPAFNIDAVGVTRPQGAAWDMGALELPLPPFVVSGGGGGDFWSHHFYG